MYFCLIFSYFLYSISKLPPLFPNFWLFIKTAPLFPTFSKLFFIIFKKLSHFFLLFNANFSKLPHFFLLFAGFLYFLMPLLHFWDIFSYKNFFIFVTIHILWVVVVSAPLFPTFLFPYFLMFSFVLPHFFLHLHLFYKTTIITNRKEEYVYGF